MAWVAAVLAVLAGVCASAGAQVPPAKGTPAAAPPRLAVLLLTPRERQTLDDTRALAARTAAFSPDGTPMDTDMPQQSLAVQPPDVLQKVADPVLAIDGYVLRQGQRSTIWLNGEPVYGTDTRNPLRGQALAAGVVRATPGGGLVLQGKPGEVWDTTAGARADLLPREAIRIQRTPVKRP